MSQAGVDVSADSDVASGFLAGVRVLELADEVGEYCGKLLAGLGADVVKVEPPGGEVTRGYGPFYRDDPHPNRSLYFWHYNFGKRSVSLDLDTPGGREAFLDLAGTADVVLDTRHRSYLSDRGLGFEDLRRLNPGLVYSRITPFGDDGPWADWKASDLVHLALGGLMMNCGYDADPSGHYELPPVAPQMWQAYAIAGELATIGILGALNHVLETGVGQLLTTSVHQAVAANTEVDVPEWIYMRRLLYRQTGRHAFPREGVDQKGSASSRIVMTKDGRWVLPYRTYLPNDSGHGSVENLIALLRSFRAGDIDDPRYDDSDYIQRPEVVAHIDRLLANLVASHTFDRDLFRDGLDAGFAWAPVRRPEENAVDPHWRTRETFIDLEYPELGETFTQIRAKWVAPGIPWRSGPRAPLMGEHTAAVREEWARLPPRERPPLRPVRIDPEHRPPTRKFALTGVRVVDLTWMLASAGAGRYLAAQGAEVIKVEHHTRLDMMRFGRTGPHPLGREACEAADGPMPDFSSNGSPNRSGGFLEANPGKRAISLNLKTEQGKELLRRLLENADIVIEGFSSGTMERMGFGYEELRRINPRLVYVSQSGLGQQGTYGRVRSFGPPAQAFAGLTDMTGLPEPHPPAGIGYSYLDWWGAYQMAVAVLAGLYRQRATGMGCWIDSSQVESGLYLTGTAVLDWSANGRSWRRYGNRSPYKVAAPAGAYRCAGTDRWIAICAHSDSEWRALVRVLDAPHLADDPRLATLQLRLADQDYLDERIESVTVEWDPFVLMQALQAEGVPAGVCQTAQDRYTSDPQLAHLGWMVDLEQTECGSWPARELPTRFSETPSYIGGPVDRHAPNYGEDNDYVYGTLLGLSAAERAALADADVI